VTQTFLPPHGSRGEAVLVFAPTGPDAELIGCILEHSGRTVMVEPTVESLGKYLGEAGAAVLAEEALLPRTPLCLTEAIKQQPSWSDIPLVVLTSAMGITRPIQPPVETLRSQANVTLLERPVHPVTLATTLDSAIRARRRQYEVRDYLIERELTEERVRRSQKMEAIGHLAGGVAHEVNNMMTAVIGFGEMVLSRLGQADGIRSDIEEMVKAGNRAAAITQQLLAFSRQQVLQPSVLRVERLVGDLATLLRRLLGADLELALHLPVDLGSIRADRNQLEQMLVNLTVNARDAMQSGGVFTIAANNTELDTDFAREHALGTFRPGPYVLIEAHDTGQGMEQAVIDHAFEPFFTTKPAGRGTGLGLSTVYGIVKQSDGYIFLYSKPGEGTMVRIFFPVVDAAGPQEAPGPASVRCGNETVLVAEDERAVRRLVKTALEEQGYRVLSAVDGDDALRILSKLGDQIDALLTDTVMPRMGGRELARQARLRFPSLPVLFMSGYLGNDVEERGLLEPGVPFVQKPFSTEELAQRVRAVLDEARSVAQP
jgi:two-component system cell cycle sensor histidine kinase/response regulator CckA